MNTPHTLQSRPEGPFRFFALDVETANRSSSSICQIGAACVRAYGYKITQDTIEGAPDFPTVLAHLRPLLDGEIVFQHSSFDQTAIRRACLKHELDIPNWRWRDSVKVARKAWPQLRGSGGFGLASLKDYLSLEFRHHDGEEDARASAEIVLSTRAFPAQNALTLRLSEFKCQTINPICQTFNRSSPESRQKRLPKSQSSRLG